MVGGWEQARRAVDRWLRRPGVELVLLLLILASVALTVSEVVVPPAAAVVVARLSDAVTLVFVVELALRFFVARRKARFFERYWVDLLAVAPMVRVLRVLRVLRLFRAAVLVQRRLSGPAGRRVGTSGEFLVLSMGTLTLVLLCAWVMLAVEGGRPNGIGDLEDALWFAAFSLVAGEPVGVTPVTEVGRWTTLILMVGGLSLFGVFVGTVSAGMVSRLSRRLEDHEVDVDELVGHVLVCGWNKAGATVLRELFGPGAPTDRAVVLITEIPVPDEQLPPGVPQERLYRRLGDYTRADVLEQVNVREATSVVLLADELVPRSSQDCDARTVLAALTIERRVKGIYTMAELHSRQSEELLRQAGVEDVVVADVYAGMILGSVQRNRGLVRVLDEILTQTHGNAFYTHPLPARWVGWKVKDVVPELYGRHRAILVSVEVAGRTVVNPPPELVLPADSRLVVLQGDDYRPL